MTTATEAWTPVCSTDAILANAGISAVHKGRQVAIFKVDEEVFALSNIDPFSGAGVLSRGIIGDRSGVLKVASPLYKQNFCLQTGQCLDDESVRIPAYETRIVDGTIEIGPEKAPVAAGA